jgi:GT2 family glycosyltransferase
VLKRNDIATLQITRSDELAAQSIGAVARNVVYQIALQYARTGSTVRLFQHGLRYVRANGLRATLSRLADDPSYNTATTARGRSLVRARYAALARDAQERLFKRGNVAAQATGPTISILLPFHKTPRKYLEAAINSVIRQTYPNWELCIVDDGSQSEILEHTVNTFARRDPRIKFKPLAANIGISAATNEALALASGTFIGLLDHDDLLARDALEQVAQVLLTRPDLDLIYSDECKVRDNGKIDDIFTKPDWDPLLLLNYMYIGHFSVYRRSLVVDVGGFRSSYDFSQDYDLALRVTEKTDRIHHIERILYGWRRAPGSAATGHKDYAQESNIAALRSAIKRRHWGSGAVASPTGNRVQFGESRDYGLASIIIPSDNEQRILKSIWSIIDKSTYRNLEIVVVTRSATIASIRDNVAACVKFAAFDEAFNFSAKCNAGVRAATGEFVVFFNDDVRVLSPDWIETTIEYLLLDSVGAVAPKLLYENGTIQHAGLVTGVRGLVGTAFHRLPADTMAYFKLAQSVRNVSALSAACLGMRRKVFDQIGGFDADRFPIALSDIDLCLKIRRAGLQCAYVPFARLRHIGHQSLHTADRARPQHHKDKADIRLLRNWCHEISRDPFWTRSMRDFLYANSPENFEIFGSLGHNAKPGGKDILLVFHDLSNSGAPRALFEAARHLISEGHFIVAMSPEDGFYRSELQKIGAVVIVDALLRTSDARVRNFVRNFDFAIVNTVMCSSFILHNARNLDCYWYLHESVAIADHARENPGFQTAIRAAKAIWVNGERAAGMCRDLRPDIAIIEYGFAPPLPIELLLDRTQGRADARTKIGVFGSYEPRKGQDLAVAAVLQLPESLRANIELNFFGRVLDGKYLQSVRALASGHDAINLGPELSYADCRTEITRCDIVLIPSRDESMSLVGLDAIGAGKVVICSEAVGLSRYLQPGENGFVVDQPTPTHLTNAIAQAISVRARWSEIGAGAREVFNQTFTEAAFRERIVRALPLMREPRLGDAAANAAPRAKVTN